MKEEMIYLTKDFKEAKKEDAVLIVVIMYDDKGEMEKETWYEIINQYKNKEIKK